MAINPFDVNITEGHEYGLVLTTADDGEAVTISNTLTLGFTAERSSNLASILSEHLEACGVELGYYTSIVRVADYTAEAAICDCEDRDGEYEGGSRDESDELPAPLREINDLISGLAKTLGITDAELAEMEAAADVIVNRRTRIS